MTRFVSTRGGTDPVDFETAVTRGFAADGGLFVPREIPLVSQDRLEAWSDLAFPDLAFEILSLFIGQEDIPGPTLKRLINKSYQGFGHPESAPVIPLDHGRRHFILELFHGPTLSFKDMAMGFLINCLDYFLSRRGERLNLVVATTGDTGPAAAYASAGKKSIDCWVLYPEGMISEEQERQFTTLEADNVHGVGVGHCPDGGDDLDLAVAGLFADEEVKARLCLSSVNSINWGRVMVQAVHYFYAYLRTAETIGQPVAFAVPTGAFGNLFGGYLARAMGLPVGAFICVNNINAAAHNLLAEGVFAKAGLRPTVSSAIDIVAPYNVWRWLYFAAGRDPGKIRAWMADFRNKGRAELDLETWRAVKEGFIPMVVDDDQTLARMARTFDGGRGYLLDPHGAVALAGGMAAAAELPREMKIISLATAHPAKFPEVVRRALNKDDLPAEAIHPSLERAKNHCRRVRLCRGDDLPEALIRSMTAVMDRREPQEA